MPFASSAVWKDSDFDFLKGNALVGISFFIARLGDAFLLQDWGCVFIARLEILFCRKIGNYFFIRLVFLFLVLLNGSESYFYKYYYLAVVRIFNIIVRNARLQNLRICK